MHATLEPSNVSTRELSTHFAREVLSRAQLTHLESPLNAFQRGVFIGQIDLLQTMFCADEAVCEAARDVVLGMREWGQA